MKLIVTMCLALAAVVTTMPAQAKDFIFVHNGGTDLRFIDRSSISRVDDTTKSAWFVVIFDDTGVVHNVKQHHVLFHVRCDSKQWAMRASNAFDRDGKSLETVSVADTQLVFTPAAPDTVIGRVSDYICGTRTVGDADLYQATDAWHLQAGYDRLRAGEPLP